MKRQFLTFYDGEVVPGQKRMYYGMKRRLVITDYEDPEAQDYFEPEEQDLYSDRQLMLCDLFENNRSCVYSYDFGDDWEHVITVEERKQKDGSTRFVLLEKEGDRPPEDVGWTAYTENMPLSGIKTRRLSALQDGRKQSDYD